MSAVSNGGRVPDSFGYHLAGIIDGEGHFAIAKQVKPRTGLVSYMCSFHINLRDDDTAVLEMIQERLGIGALYVGLARRNYKHPRDAKPITQYRLQNKQDCLRLVDLLERYPLWTKKARDFRIWAKAVRYMLGPRPQGIEPMARWFEEIRAIRQYDAPISAEEVYELDALTLWDEDAA